MMNKLQLTAFGLVLLFAAAGCKWKSKPQPLLDTYISGTAKLIVDESFSPIIDQEAFVFKAFYKQANPQIIYKPESEVLNLLLNDSIRFAILSRNLNESEIKLLKSRTLLPVIDKFAIDAVALIVNKASTDTSTSMLEIKKMLTGQAKVDRSIVFDNPNSSLARFLKDFSGNQTLQGKNIYALKSSKDVIKYVSQHPQAIGITGFSWLDDPDKDYAADLNNVRILSVKDESSKTAPGQYFAPSQTTLALKQYPLSRSLYTINCTGRMGLASGFGAFLRSERGQRIILKSGLLPDSIPGREIHIVTN